jgi:hypothetical protein
MKNQELGRCDYILFIQPVFYSHFNAEMLLPIPLATALISILICQLFAKILADEKGCKYGNNGNRVQIVWNGTAQNLGKLVFAIICNFPKIALMTSRNVLE